MASEHRLALRVAHLARIFAAIIEYVRRGGGLVFQSRDAPRGEAVITMRVQEPEKLDQLLDGSKDHSIE